MYLLDIAPYPEERFPRIRETVTDTIDTMGGAVGQFSDQVQNTNSPNTLLWTILVALVALGVCLFMVRNYRKHALATT